MSCGSCAARVERTLARHPGVSEAGVNFATGRATVTFDPNAVSGQELAEAVEGIGYRLRPFVPAEPRSEDNRLAAIEFGHECCRKIAAAIKQMVAACGKTKRIYTPAPLNQELYDQVAAAARHDLKESMNTQKYPKLESYAKVAELKKRVVEALPEEAIP